MPKLTEPKTYEQVIGSLMLQPVLYTQIEDEVNPLADIDSPLHSQLFRIVYGFISQGAESVSIIEIEAMLEGSKIAKVLYERNNGRAVLEQCLKHAKPENFMVNWKRMKKLALLRELKANNFNISSFYCEEPMSYEEEMKIEDHFNETPIERILTEVESTFVEISRKYVKGIGGSKTAAEGVKALIGQLAATPSSGPPTCGKIMSCMCRGARKGTLVIQSSKTNQGKTRASVFDMCKICYPVHWGMQPDGKMGFVEELMENGQRRPANRCLFITTEMKPEEIQTIILAYLSGVDEQKILDGSYGLQERKQIDAGIAIMNEYAEDFYLEEITDPNLINIQACIKRYVLMKDVEYITYDYLFTSPSLIAQFSGMKLREDNALALLANQLKEIAKNYNVYIKTSTQVNAEGMKWDSPRDESVLRGAKSIADKADIGYIFGAVYPEEKEMLRKSGAFSTYEEPTHVYDIYKMRRGRWKSVRIWSKLDLGTGQQKDLFVTDKEYHKITPEMYDFGEERAITL